MAPSANVLPKMTVVLDMDETLIHSRFLEMSEAETVEMRQAEERQSNVKSVDDSFHVVLTEGGPKTTVAVNRRPQLAAFLESLAARWRVVIFTAATQDYADPVLDVIDPTDVVMQQQFEQADAIGEIEEAFHLALAALPENQRNAILLLQQQGLAYDEIAEALNTNLSSVKTWIHRARTHLRKELKDFT